MSVWMIDLLILLVGVPFLILAAPPAGHPAAPPRALPGPLRVEPRRVVRLPAHAKGVTCPWTSCSWKTPWSTCSPP